MVAQIIKAKFSSTALSRADMMVIITKQIIGFTREETRNLVSVSSLKLQVKFIK